MTSPSLAELVHVRAQAVRSINVRSDLLRADIAEDYLLTPQARGTLARIFEGFREATPTRAWTLTGPYGSGKSYFGLFMMNLACTALPAHGPTQTLLRRSDPLLLQSVGDLIGPNGSRGLLPVPIVGYRAPLHECLHHGLQSVLQPLAVDGSIRGLLAEDAWSQSTSSRDILEWLDRLLAVITRPVHGYSGILLILDEMGKLLEFAAAHPDVADIYLLRELAEFANRSNGRPLVFLGILHQAFERYAGALDGATQREWAKVQGRFADVAFQEPPNQQMWLVANALEYSKLNALADASDLMQQYASEAAQSGWSPSLMGFDEFAGLCARSYPLHPSALVALPYLFRRLAQNERSLFAYLTSHEPFGFQEFLQQHSPTKTIRLSQLFDYLVANFQGRLYASQRARPLTETLERLAGATQLSPLESDLLKSIGMLNWLSEVSPLQARGASLHFALRSPEYSDADIDDALATLRRRSLAVYRRFNQTYSVWHGSDVDIEERLTEAHQRTAGVFSLAAAVQEHLPPRPLVARRHSYKTGAVRYFEVRYVDSLARDQTNLESERSASGIVLLCLAASQAEVEAFTTWAQQVLFQERPDLVVCVLSRTPRLAELLNELRCLHWVREHTPELRDDPVARRELRTRVHLLETAIRNELEQALVRNGLADAQGSRWFRRGRQVSAERGLSHLLSVVCDELYPDSPRLWNELINRRYLTSQGAAARRNLIEAMLSRSAQPELGIAGYPPERSMYESLLRASGLHHPVGPAYWEFSAPPENDPLSLQSAWQAIGDFIFAMPPEPRGVQALFELLSAPPYGLTAGVVPVLLCAFLIVHQDETTLYREGTLLPEPGIADWEVLLRRPELFAVAGCRVTGLRAAVMERMARGLRVPPHVMPVVRAVIGRLKALPEHAWRTRRLPESALALRRVVEMARSPERFLFVEVPEALGLPPFEDGEFEQAHFDVFFERLNAALDALANATPRLLAWARDTWLAACNLPGGDEGWEMFRQQAERLAPRVMHPTLLPLLKRAVEAVDAPSALESVLAFLANRPLRTWTDADAERFEAQARYVGELWQQQTGEPAETLNLPRESRQRAESLADELERSLKQLQEQPEVLRAALQLLLQRLQTQDQ